MGLVFLAGAILLEVSATMSLRVAAIGGNKRWYVLVAVGNVGAFSLLTLALNAGLPLGVAYGIWAATGVALTAFLGRVLFKDPLTWPMIGGIALIIAGVIVVESGAMQ